MKKIIILGATGSIGQQALNVIRTYPDRYQVSKISIGYNIEKLKDILNEFTTIKEVALLDESNLSELKKEYPLIKFHLHDKGILDLLDNDYDIALNAVVGFAGLMPSIKVIEQSKSLALANKETMVVAGDIINNLLKKYPMAKIIPVDSEHCAIFQCFENRAEVKRLIITASGGSLRDYPLEAIKDVSVEQVLNHPNWNMGASITVDSATMFNKGLEVIEAHYLFNIDYENIDVVIHRESLVHSMVEYVDKSIIAQISYPNMEQPIEFAFNYPQRLASKLNALDFTNVITMNFEPVDYQRFPALKLAYEAGKKGQGYPCVLNASKEEATKAFLDKKIKFLDIINIVEKVLKEYHPQDISNVQQLIEIDKNTRGKVRELIFKGGI